MHVLDRSDGNAVFGLDSYVSWYAIPGTLRRVVLTGLYVGGKAKLRAFVALDVTRTT